MKRQLFMILGVGLLACAVCAEDQKPAPKPTPAPVQVVPPNSGQKPEEKTDYSKIFKTDKEKLSYAIGMWASGNLKAPLSQLKGDDIEIDSDILLKAFKDNITGAPTQINDLQTREIIMGLDKDLRAKKAEKQKAMGEKNQKEGEAFLAANKSKDGIKSFDSGLQYQVVTEGAGDMPKPGDTVTVNYRGTLLDGSEFDASKPGQPASFPVTGVIPGWTEALEHMKSGSKWKLFIPSSLAYGERGHPPKIMPNAALIFEVELLSIKPAAAPAPTPAAPPAAGAKPPGNGAVASASPPLTSDIIKVPSAEELKKGAKIETIKAEDIEKEKAKTNN